MSFRMSRQEIFDRPALVRPEVVDDHVNLFSAGLVDHDGGEERDELGGSVARGGLTQHLTGLCVESSVEGKRAVPEVLVSTVATCPKCRL